MVLALLVLVMLLPSWMPVVTMGRTRGVAAVADGAM